VKAAPALETAVALDPDFPAAWVRLSTAYEHLGFDEKALDAARQGIAHLGEGAGRIGLEARSREAVLSGDFERAQQLLTGLIERYPHDIEARVALAEAFGEHGRLERARQELLQIVAASPNHPRAWYLLGKYAILAGDRRAAVDEYLVRALVIQNKLGNLQGRGDVENALGIAHFQLGQLDQAAERYRNAIELRRQIGDQRGVAAATANVARIDLRRGDFDRARTGLQQALEVVEAIGDRQTVANLHNEIGSLEEQRGDYRAALERYRRALAALRDLGNQRSLAESYNNVGFAYLLLGDFSNAEVYAAQAVQLYRRTENREGVMLAGQTIGLLEIARGDWNAAEKALLEVLQLSRELADPLAEAVAHGNLGRIAQYQGRFGAAQRSYESALTVLEPLANTRAQAEFTLYRSELAFELGMNEAGNEGLKKVAEWLPQGGNREQKADWLRLTGIGQLRAGNVAAASKSFAAAQSEAEASGSVLARLAAGIAAAEVQLANHETRPARAALESLKSQAQGLGHVMLQLRSGELLARAHAESQDWAAAERELRSSLRLADSLQLYSGRYRLHALLGDACAAQGKDVAAAEQRRAAAAELQRLRDALDESQRDAFDRLMETRLAKQDAPRPAA
jgi:tetratricopeptide (TPR) repeat protein